MENPYHMGGGGGSNTGHGTIDVDISTKNVAVAEASRKVCGRFAEGSFPTEARGRDPFDLHIVV